jgi:serine/threonine-protein kinase SRPK3
MSEYSDSEDDYVEDNTVNFIGSIIKNNYIIIYKLGKGSFASVWLAYSYNDKNFYAIKIQSSYYSDHAIDEIELYKQFKKSNNKYLNLMIESMEYKSDEGIHLCMVFKLMAGSVYDIIREGKYKNGLPVDIVSQIINQVMIALNELHHTYKKIHTDVKPENILIEGISKKTSKVIEHFKKIKFDSYVNKKKKGNRLESAVKLIINKLYELNDDTLYTSRISSNSSDITHNTNSDDELSISDFDESDIDDEYDIISDTGSDTVSDTGSKCPIEDKYLTNIKIVLSDFGSIVDIGYKYYDIQTRYYRAPEIILKHPFGIEIDIWSVYCMRHELLSGKILYNPSNRRRYNADKCHLYDILHKSHIIFKNRYIKHSKYGKLYFRKSGLLK